MAHHLGHLQLLGTGESSGPFPRICPSHTYKRETSHANIVFQVEKGGKKRAAASLCNDSVDLFRNKARDCPGGRRRYHCNAGIYERQFQLRGGKNSATFYVKTYFTCIADV